MDKFLAEVKSYADAVGVLPATVVQRAGAGNGSTWYRWVARTASPTMATVDKVRGYMASNLPPSDKANAA
ncbi:XRE family transcriptional regulator [Pseudooceanicola sp.]|uniref:XRE family transcriptional regulator n=1 Tax=Pseudooceanicola sp. TaxID=1914328 RepID=UPI0035163EB5